MASFVPYHRKKQERLERNEEVLRRLIERGASREKLLKAALELRDGRIRVLRAKQNQNPERNVRERAVYLKDEEKIKVLRAVTAEAILAEFVRTATHAKS
jgi:hypothetical protein